MSSPIEGGTRPIRVLLADASRLVRREVAALLSADGRIEVVASVGDGLAAIEARESRHPDVVLLDLALPRLDGLEAIRWMMFRRPVPIVVLASAKELDGHLAEAALALGAIETLAKPDGPASLELTPIADILLHAVRRAARIRVVRNTARAGGAAAKELPADAPLPRPRRTSPPLDPGLPVVALTASTGGPVALQRVLDRLPASLPAAVLVCQHLPPGFTSDLAGLLRRASRMRVQEAVDGSALEAGVVHVAPGGRNLALRGRRLLLREAPLRECGPSADVLFQSMADEVGPGSVGVVLTGMGRDGARGARRIRESGGAVIVQDERTSVVYGMPAAALSSGAASLQLPIEAIGPAVARLVRDFTCGRAA